MTTIKIDFTSTNHLKEWILRLDEWLRENDLANPPRQPRSVFWRSNRGFNIHYPLASDSIFNRFPDFPNGVTLTMTDVEGDSKFELSVSKRSLIDANFDPPSGFLSLISNLTNVPFMKRQLECGTLVKDVLPSPIRFAIANMPTYVGAMVEGSLLQRENELNDRLSRHFMRVSSVNTTKKKLLDFFSSYGVLAFVLNHIHWDTIGLRPILEPIHKHWKGLGHSSTTHSIPTSTHYVATSGATTLGNSEPTTIAIRHEDGSSSARWIRTSQGSALNPQAISGYAYSNFPTDFDPLP